MVIHFVCRANIYRSRLAEAYAKSLTEGKTNLHIISSGIEAKLNLNGPIAFVTQQVLKENSLLQLTKPSWAQTTQKLIDDSDVIVFMDDDVYNDATKFLKIPSTKYYIWHIPDVVGIFDQIKPSVNELLAQLKLTQPP